MTISMKILKLTDAIFFSVYIFLNYIQCSHFSEANLEKIDLHVHLLMLSVYLAEGSLSYELPYLS